MWHCPCAPITSAAIRKCSFSAGFPRSSGETLDVDDEACTPRLLPPTSALPLGPDIYVARLVSDEPRIPEAVHAGPNGVSRAWTWGHAEEDRVRRKCHTLRRNAASETDATDKYYSQHSTTPAGILLHSPHPWQFLSTSTPDTMSAIHLSAQALSYLYTSINCGTAVCALLVYDWLLCLSQEVRFIWNWRSGVTISSLLYVISRYMMLVYSFLSLATIHPMSDLSCRADVWAQTAIEVLCLITFSAFSALRAYALSNRNTWLAVIIVLLALPPTAMRIIQSFYQAPENLPSPLNCSSSASLSPTLSISVIAVLRGSQFAAELLVIGITWWYTYRSYRIQKGVNLGKTISSLLVYNGSIYFLFLATLYVLDIILTMASVPEDVRDAAAFMETFVDPMTSILTCHFMLSLREFDSIHASAMHSGTGSQVREPMASTVLEFAAEPSDTLPSFIASFAHPVHVDSVVLEPDSDAIVDEWREMDGVVPTLETPSCQSPAADQPSDLERSV